MYCMIKITQLLQMCRLKRCLTYFDVKHWIIHCNGGTEISYPQRNLDGLNSSVNRIGKLLKVHSH